jgi:hypothetical protein
MLGWVALLAFGCRTCGLLEDTDDPHPDPPHRSLRTIGSPMTATKGRSLSRTGWVVAAVVLLVIIVTSILGIFWALIGLLGFVGLIIGIVILAKKGSRKAGTLAILVGLLFAFVGSGLNSVVQQPDSDTASVEEASATPVPTPEGTTKATPKPTLTPTPTPTPVATQAEVQESSVIPYVAVMVDDNTIDVGTSAITVGGVNGEKVTTYLVQYIDGVEISRAVAREEVTVAAVDEVTANGSRVPAPAPVAAAPSAFYENCDAVRAAGAAPIYTADPGYSRKLDRDGDGVACET